MKINIFGYEINIGRSKKKQQRTYYQGGVINRLTNDWLTPTLSSDDVLRGQLNILRLRSRDLELNNDYMKNFLRRLEINVVGPNGIGLQSDIRFTNTGRVYKEANDRVESAWAEWCKKKNCTVSKNISFRNFLSLVIKTVARDGEAFIVKHKGFNNDFNFALQLIEADMVDEQYNKKLENGNKIRLGIEFNEYGEPLAYYFKDTENIYSKYIRVKASDVIHVFIQDRVTQARGVPWAHSAIMRLRMLGSYEEATLVAARVGAAKMGFITRPPGFEYSAEQDEEGRYITEVEPGLIEMLPAGAEFKTFDPSAPDDIFKDFQKAMLRGICAGLGVNYNTLVSDLESVNYSSLRGGTLEEREFWRKLQNWFIDSLLNDVYEDWLKMAILSSKVDLDPTLFEKWNKPKWIPRMWDWVDPEKDVSAKVLELQSGLTTRTKILAEKGMEFEEVVDELKQEADYMKEAGLYIDLYSVRKQGEYEKTYKGGNGDNGNTD